ncbi:MAG: hypothetical protein LBK76_05540 [Verrucomicrobiales bacterium]|nr:hypothetical protein [Verrucomicrobiales bacterium]
MCRREEPSEIKLHQRPFANLQLPRAVFDIIGDAAGHTVSGEFFIATVSGSGYPAGRL